MPRNAVPARGRSRSGDDDDEVDDEPTASGFARRIGWVVLAGSWVFAAIALASFDASDWPSLAVAVHNQPPRNLCGPVGAVVAYWSWHVLGVGAWVILAGVAGGLVAAGLRHRVTHPVVRVLGLALMAVAVSGCHALWAPGSGVLAGSGAGLLAFALIGELSERFSTVGTSLVLLAALSIGTVVCVDRLVTSVPGWAGAAWSGLRRLRLPGLSWRGLRARPEAAAAAAGGGGDSTRRGRRGRSAAAIDPVAGGIGATESFDPEEHEIGDEGEAADGDEGDEGAPAARPKLGPRELREKLAKLPLRMSSRRKEVARDEDIPRQESSFEGYRFPSIDLLEDPESNYSGRMEAFVRKQAEQLESALRVYGIDGEVTGIESGPVVTLYSVQLAPGTKVAKVQAVASDLARALRAHNIRIVPNMVGKTTVGIEVPNLYKERVRLKELMSSGHAEGMMLPMFLGKDVSGEPLVADLTSMPHMLIAGTTGSGKSVCINTIIMSWLYTKRPDELKLVLVDPKMVEMSQFQDIPHLMCPVVTETARATAILEWAVEKMEERYELLKEAGVRNVAGYNRLEEAEILERFQPANEAEKARIPRKLPFIVFMIDELADLIMTHCEVEQAIVRIAQKARAVGMHLIVATQRPQANVVTGLIKSNMPCRASFKVASGMDSRIVLDQKGAELLLGQGDMLFLTPHTSELKRAQGTLVTDGEIRQVAKFLRGVATPTFEPALLTIRPAGEEDTDPARLAERDPLFDEAVRIMIETERGSVSLLQRRLAIGYTRASRLVDQMAMAGILGDHKGSVARQVLITLDEWEQMREMEEAAEASGTLFEGEEEGEEEGDGEEKLSAVSSQLSAEEEDEDEDESGDEGDDDDEYEYVDEDEEDEVEEEDDAPIVETVKPDPARKPKG